MEKADRTSAIRITVILVGVIASGYAALFRVSEHWRVVSPRLLLNSDLSNEKG